MPWFKVDDAFHGHPKVMELSPGAVGVWTLAGSWCANYLTDGEIKAGVVRRFGATEEMIRELVESGLWIEREGATYQFKDWDHYQPLKSDIEAERDAARERMKAVRAKKKGVERSGEVLANNTGTFGGSSQEVRVTPSQSQSLSHPDPGGSGETPKKHRRNLPASWAPTSAHKEYANTEGISIDFQAESFRNHAEANDRKLVDWDAGFRNWLLKAERTIKKEIPHNPLWDP